MAQTDYQSRVVSVESLPSAQREILDRIVKLTRPHGVCVSALCGGEPWDVRPVHLHAGAMTITRMSAPGLARRRSDFQRFNELLMRLRSAPIAQGTYLQHGECEGQLWVRRTFFSGTLSDEKDGVPRLGIEEIRALVAQVRTLHEHGVIHGHLVPSNVALVDGYPVVLDIGMAVNGGANLPPIHGLAPELLRGRHAGSASDMYGLGIILRELGSHLWSADHKSFLEQLMVSDPAQRPVIDRLESVLRAIGPSDTALSAQRPGRPAGGAPADKSLVRSGKLLTGAARVEAPQQPPRAQVPAPRDDEHPYEPYEEDYDAEESAPPPPPRERRRPRRTPSDREEGSQPAPSRAQPPAQAPAVAGGGPSMATVWLVACMCAAGVAYLSPLKLEDFTFWKRQASVSQEEYAELWKSEQPALMQQVARAAVVDEDPRALSVIVKDIQKGEKPQLVRSDILRTAFDVRWQAQLTEEDRATVFKVSLYQLLKPADRALPDLTDAHPGVLLALLGHIQLDSAGDQFALPLDRMTKLPEPMGPAFAELQKLKVKTLEDLPARALSHIFVGDVSPETVSRFIGADSEIRVAFARASLLVKFVGALNPQIEDLALAALAARSPEVGARLGWFEQEKLAEWSTVKAALKLYVISGSLPQEDLTFEQYIDLLKFPSEGVRTQSAKLLQADYFENRPMSATLGFLATDENDLTRSQTIALVSALRLRGDAAFSYLDKWFQTGPDVRSIFEVLAARAEDPGLDPFNVTAARYLVGKEWRRSFDDVRRLSHHPEPLARALAYAALDVRNPREREFIEQVAEHEPNKRIREQLRDRLKTASGQSARLGGTDVKEAQDKDKRTAAEKSAAEKNRANADEAAKRDASASIAKGAVNEKQPVKPAAGAKEAAPEKKDLSSSDSSPASVSSAPAAGQEKPRRAARARSAGSRTEVPETPRARLATTTSPTLDPSTLRLKRANRLSARP